MTQTTNTATEAEDRLSLDRRALELEQARLLYERAQSSAVSVLTLVAMFSAIMAFVAGAYEAVTWFVVAVGMIGVTLLQPRLFTPPGVVPDNAATYLAVHTLISGVTGAVWGIGAAWMADPGIPMSVYTGVVMVVTITLGGISPQSAFRRSYVALATMTMLPFAIWVLFSTPWPMNANGIGVVVAYAFFMAVSARVEIGTRDLIAAKRNVELTEELRRQRDAVQKANEEKTRFLAATSHDLAQPLHAQGFYISALREKTKDPEARALVDKVALSWRSLGQLLDGLVEINRLDAGAVLPSLGPVELKHHAQRVVQDFEGQAEELGLRLSLEGEECVVQSDAALLSRILGNIVSNAIKYTPAGGTVTVTIAQDAEFARLCVADTGIGIPAQSIESVFGEYVQLGNPERNRNKGLGLGLSIVRRLAQLLSLDVKLKSDPGKGTTVTLDIPLSGAGAGATDLVPDPHLDDRQRISSLRVLIVDDEEAIRLSMSEVLTSWGCEVYCTGGQGSIVDFLDRMDATPDVVIADHRLGNNTDGLQLIETVRQELNETVFAILMTGDPGMPLLPEEHEQTKILFKPIDPSSLRALLLKSLSYRMQEQTESADESV